LIVQGFNKYDNVLELSKNYTAKIEPGDQVLTIKGLTFEQYVKKYKFNSGGSTEDGSMRAALTYMSTRNGQSMKMPNGDFVRYVMKSKRTGKVYHVDLPWITISFDKCVNDSKTLDPINTINTRNLQVAENINMIAYKQSFFTKSLVNVQRTEEPILTWTIHDPTNRNLGVIFLESFSPRGNDNLKVTKLIRSLLLNQLKNTKSLVFDVRNNVGGAIEMADLLPQLFGLNITTITGRVLQSDINRKLFENAFVPTNAWAVAYKDMHWYDKYSKNVGFTHRAVANSLGQAYIKPVAVFTNARCYSACEIFAANMKDNKIAIIFGEDRNTGGGGNS
jgi:C-terminal processing protease CtpA/Prc